MVKRLLSLIQKFRNQFPVDARSQSWIDSVRERRVRNRFSPSSSKTSKILVEFFPLPISIIVMSLFTETLRRKNDASVVSVSYYTHSYSWFYLFHRKLIKVYRSFTEGHLHIHDERKRFHSEKIQKAYEHAKNTIKTKQQLLEFEIEGLSVGIDLFETYLREFEQPTVDLNDSRYDQMLLDFVRDYYFWVDYLSKNKVEAVVANQGIYRFGLLSRIADRYGIPTYAITPCGFHKRYFSKTPLKDRRFVDYSTYNDIFNSLSPEEKTRGIELAKNQLAKRMNAEVGVNMAYSTKSAFHRSFSKERVLANTKKLKVLITTHSFFDNPHAYGWSLFPDFYDWLCFLGEMANTTDYEWYVKTHRDLEPSDQATIEEIIRKYPKLRLIDKHTSFHQLIAEGLSHVMTLYGSVGHELPLLGMTVITAGYNPHSPFGFTVNPKTLDEYRKIILDLPNVKLSADHEEIYRFYFIHYYACQIITDLFFDDYYVFIGKMGKDRDASTEYYTEYLSQLTDKKFREIEDKIRWYVNSGEEWFINYNYLASKKNDVIAVLQARASSARLPGKVLKPILDEPMLARQIERIRRAGKVDRMIVCTSTDASDDPIEVLCEKLRVDWYRGSLDNVLDRVYQSVKALHPKLVIRLTADCPLTDPELIDRMIDYQMKNGFDYLSNGNGVTPTFPDGLDVEIMSYDTLEKAWKNATKKAELEHVTYYIYTHPSEFKIGAYTQSVDHSSLRWTVDEAKDFELVTKIYETLYPIKPAFTTNDILSLLEKHPELRTFNTQHKRNEGLERSLEEQTK